MLKRLVIELPFLAFALFLPFVGRASRSRCSGLSLSVSGLWGAWNIVVKGTLGVAASIVLASTTTVPELLRGLDRLRLPRVLTGIMGFMIRYGDVIADEMRRMRIARIAARLRPAMDLAGQGGGVVGRRPVHPQLRAGRAGPRGHAGARATTASLPVVDDETGAPAQLARSPWPCPPQPSSWPPSRGRCDDARRCSQVEGLAYAYPDGRQVLFGVDLRVHEGERVAILGPNGAGKTTLVLHLNGTLQAGAGRVSVDGLPVAKEHLKEIRRAGRDRVPGSRRPAVHADGARRRRLRPGQPRLPRAGAGRAGRRGARRGGHARTCADRPPHHLSFGQRRRVAAATVLSMDPRVLVLDEPSSNLDPMARREFAEIVLSLGLTTLMVTHDLPYALQLCPRAVVLNDGVIVADGPTRELLADEALMRANRLELPFGFALPEEAPTGPR